MKNFSRHHRPGAVLLLSLLLMTSVVATTIGISVIITNDFSQSRAVEDFTRASYAADTGIERGLAFIEAGRKSDSLDNAIAAATGTISAIGQASAQVEAEPGLDNPTLSLPNGATIAVDIFVTGATPISHLTLSSTTAGQVEVRWSLITATGAPGSGRRVEDLPAGGEKTINLNDVASEDENTPGPFAGGAVLGYRVQIKNVGGSTLASLTLDGRNAAATSFPLTSTIHLTAVGTSFESIATKEVTTFWQRPASGLFNYVIYTEGDIVPE